MAVAPSPSRPENRERLLAATADALRDGRALAEVTVADVVARARTSRRTFYEEFGDREECLLALFDDVSERLMAAITEAAAADAEWTERIDRALAAYLAAVSGQREVTRTLLHEIPSLGPRGVDRLRRMNQHWAASVAHLVQEAAADDPHVRPISPEVATVICGGFRDLVLWTLDQGRDPTELQPVGRDLLVRLAQRTPMEATA